MFKPTQVVLLPSQNKTNALYWSGQVLYTKSPEDHSRGELNHLYFLSDDEIQSGDWFLDLHNLDNPKRCDNSKLNLKKEQAKKIIATTDESLKVNKFNTGVFKDLLYSLPQPSQEFIDYYVDQYNKGNIITRVNVKYEERIVDVITGETTQLLEVNSDNTINISPIKDSWNIKEMEDIHVAVVKQGCLYEGGEWSDEHERLVRLEFNKWIYENL